MRQPQFIGLFGSIERPLVSLRVTFARTRSEPDAAASDRRRRATASRCGSPASRPSPEAAPVPQRAPPPHGVNRRSRQPIPAHAVVTPGAGGDRERATDAGARRNPARSRPAESSAGAFGGVAAMHAIRTLCGTMRPVLATRFLGWANSFRERLRWRGQMPCARQSDRPAALIMEADAPSPGASLPSRMRGASRRCLRRRALCARRRRHRRSQGGGGP